MKTLAKYFCLAVGP